MAFTTLRVLIPIILGSLILPTAYAIDAGRADYDLDDDGLIEINSLADLDEIRNNLDGTSLYGDSTGCPVDGCIGFELTTTLDFDTNADGKMDANDAYWNDGAGWEPIGNLSVLFKATFDGNGHQIRNLFINRRGTTLVGLFGVISGESAQLRNIGLTGEMMQVQGDYFVGGLVGYAKSAARIEQSYVTGVVTGYQYVGGLAGYLDSSVINNSYASGAVTGYQYVGGLVGYFSDSTINSSFATGAVTGNSFVSGLVGVSYSSVLTHSYWAVDTTGIGSTSVSAATLAELQCPVSGNDTSCVVDQTLYAEWDSGVWDFGTSSQLPGLILSGTTYRDSDGDGSLDEDDDFPSNRAASVDSDSDGHPDTWTLGCKKECIADSGLALDQFPNSAAAWQDGDLDGYPDSWADDCDSSCQESSDLTLDGYPNDIDNDGINNNDDTDDNNDGITDADADSDGLIEVSSLEQLNAMRYNLAGTGRTLIAGGSVDSVGCPIALFDGLLQSRCFGYELTTNLDFDTNADGVMDENDAYWNDGEGWEPVGSYENPFTAIFEGNGYQIQNLYINRVSAEEVGLFGDVHGANAVIRNVGLTGKLMSIAGRYYVGGLIGYAYGKATIEQSYSTGSVSGSEIVGGLIGITDLSVSIANVFATGAVNGSRNVGGIAGFLYLNSSLSNSLSTGLVTATDDYEGGVLGFYGEVGVTITNSYWATDTSGQLNSALESERDNYFGATLAELQCPTSSDNTDDCVVNNTLYATWDDTLWDFGTSSQLPGLIINGIVYRDGDADGVLDPNQAPSVTLTLMQDDLDVGNIMAGDGDIVLVATITDPDESDRHTLTWTYEGITRTTESDNRISLNSADLSEGEYTVSVVVTDNHYPPLSAEASITFWVYVPAVVEPEITDSAPGNTGSTSSKKSGGALSFFWLMLCGGLLFMRKQRLACGV
ncbi:GLUG motif-containing protein [Thalassolituus sp.]|uniref:GLUG motif-containing protein n=1 Tax=Thalassolituus sp. TaxID=2030822 RepID=UPI002A8328B5|nr:GLUG motif-containing protein [Thalassolituus sp.]